MIILGAILHTDEISAGTRNVEIQLAGSEPYQLAPDLLIIPVPGHPPKVSLLYKNKFLFTGDHLSWSNRVNKLVGFRCLLVFWPQLIESTRQLANYSFEWLPGTASLPR